MNKIPIIKDFLKADLPKCFKVSTSKTGLTVFVTLESGHFTWDEAHKIMRKVAKKNKLEEVHSGTNMSSGSMDWEFVNKTIEKKLVEDAGVILNQCKAFFKTWNGNEYCDSNKAYEKIEKIRAMFETAEN